MLSYFTEIAVEATSSNYNKHLYVSLVHGRYQLSTEDAIYSWGDKYSNFKKIFDQMHLEEYDIQDVLILGMGLCSIPYMLERAGHRCSYTGVEIDEEVIYLASKYVVPELESDVQIIQADAAAFVDQCHERYDLITVDLFIGQEIPAVFLNQSFVERTKHLLKENGILIYNTIGRTPELAEQSIAFYDNHFSPVFKHSDVMRVEGNLMLVSRKIN